MNDCRMKITAGKAFGVSTQSRITNQQSTSFLPCLRTRMMLLIDVLQSVQRQMRIDLRGRNIGVTQDRLHRSQVGAVFHHVRGTAMTQHVRAGVASAARGGRADHLPDALAAQSSPASAEEKKRRSPFSFRA